MFSRSLRRSMIKHGARTGSLPRLAVSAESGSQRARPGRWEATDGESVETVEEFNLCGDVRDRNLGRIFLHRPWIALATFPRGPGRTRVSGRGREGG